MLNIEAARTLFRASYRVPDVRYCIYTVIFFLWDNYASDFDVYLLN